MRSAMSVCVRVPQNLKQDAIVLITCQLWQHSGTGCCGCGKSSLMVVRSATHEHVMQTLLCRHDAPDADACASTASCQHLHHMLQTTCNKGHDKHGKLSRPPRAVQLKIWRWHAAKEGGGPSTCCLNVEVDADNATS